MSKKFFYIILSLIIFVSCSKENPDDKDMVSSCADAIEVSLQNSDYSGLESHKFGIIDIKIDNDCLIMDITYGGGCVEHDFNLLANAKVDKSRTVPTRKLSLIHNANDDNCEAILGKQLVFDLLPIRLDGHDHINVLIEGVPDTLVYDYGTTYAARNYGKFKSNSLFVKTKTAKTR